MSCEMFTNLTTNEITIHREGSMAIASQNNCDEPEQAAHSHAPHS